MSRVTISEVQTWLDPTMIKIEEGDLIEEQHLFGESVIGKLSVRFDTSTWVDSTNTPSLVRSCIAMLCAAWRYNILYSKAGSGQKSPHSRELEEIVWGRSGRGGIITGILLGHIDLQDVADTPAKIGVLTGFGGAPPKFAVGLEF